MRYAKWAFGALVTLLLVVAIVGWVLPVEHEASRSALVPGDPLAVYAVVSNVEAYPSWWPEISRVEMLPDSSGRIRFREHMSTGPVVMEVDEAVAPTRFVTRIADPDQPFGGTWTFEIAPVDGGGSRVTITERGEIYNPFFRFLSRLVFGYTGTIESFLTALHARVQ
jgi:ribosome-associated toxin RatA of RatAB toxin-antitoxin module